MRYGGWINDLPTGFFGVVRVTAFACGAGFAGLAYWRELTFDNAGTDHYVGTLHGKDMHGTVIVQ